METIFQYSPSFLCEQFKSYYVVWKLNIQEIIFGNTRYGLNRTMQYGNSILQKDDMFEIEV